jgi:hypothetical protein
MEEVGLTTEVSEAVVVADTVEAAAAAFFLFFSPAVSHDPSSALASPERALPHM